VSPIAQRCDAAESGSDPHELPAPLARLYEEHFDFVWRNARRLGVPAANAEDVAQDVFLIVHRRLTDFRGGRLRPWIFGILSRVVHDYHRSHRRKAARWMPLLHDPAPSAEQAPQGPGEWAERAERARLVESLLDRLDEEQRSLIVLGVLEQWSLRELADYYHCNLHTVYARLRSAKLTLERAYRRAVARLGSEP